MSAARPTALVALFDDRLEAEACVKELEADGFKPDQIGYAIRGIDDVAGGTITDADGVKDAKGAVEGMIGGGVIGGIIAAAVAVMIPGIGPVLAGGVLASFFGGAIAGAATGGIIGALTGLGVSEEEAKRYEGEFARGRAIVAVSPGFRAADAAEIMRRHGGYDLHNEAASPVETTGFLARP